MMGAGTCASSSATSCRTSLGHRGRVRHADGAGRDHPRVVPLVPGARRGADRGDLLVSEGVSVVNPMESLHGGCCSSRASSCAHALQPELPWGRPAGRARSEDAQMSCARRQQRCPPPGATACCTQFVHGRRHRAGRGRRHLRRPAAARSSASSASPAAARASRTSRSSGSLPKPQGRIAQRHRDDFEGRGARGPERERAAEGPRQPTSR